MRNIITLTTDFGLKDHYVGAMKGVILSRNQDAKIIDISHEIDSFDIQSTSFLINGFYKYFPRETINVVVVDPGVGSSRKPILVCADDYYFIGPDNGIFSLIYKFSSKCEVRELSNSEYFLDDVSSTFHGRDIFASVAAYLSIGTDPFDFGNLINIPVKFDISEYFEDDNCIRGEIIYSDKFGNLVSNIPSDKISKDSYVKIDNEIIDNVSESYSDVKKGELLAIIGSSGLLEISVNQGSAKNIISSNEIKIIKN